MYPQDETLYQASEQNSMATPPPFPPMDPQSAKGKSKAPIIAGSIAGAVGVSSLAAWGIYEYLNRHSEPASADDVANVASHVDNADLSPDPVIVNNNVTYVHHVQRSAARPVENVNARPVAGATENVQLIEYEVDGERVIVGMQYDGMGHRVLLVDYDRDGVFDQRVCDINDNGRWEQVTDLTTTGEPLLVENFELDIRNNGITPNYSYINNVDNGGNIAQSDDNGTADGDDSVLLSGFERITDDNGNTMDVARLQVNGRNVILVDNDGDGRYDYIGSDLNNDGQIDTNEMERTTGEITTRGVAQFDHTPDFTDPNNLAQEYDKVSQEDNPDEDEPIVDGLPAIEDDPIFIDTSTQITYIDTDGDGLYDLAQDSMGRTVDIPPTSADFVPYVSQMEFENGELAERWEMEPGDDSLTTGDEGINVAADGELDESMGGTVDVTLDLEDTLESDNANMVIVDDDQSLYAQAEPEPEIDNTGIDYTNDSYYTEDAAPVQESEPLTEPEPLNEEPAPETTADDFGTMGDEGIIV